MKTSNNSTGILMATAVAALFMSGAVLAAEGSAEEAKVHCAGINSCKGTSECKTGTNECKGKNACSGKGFISTTEKECTEKGGKVI
jgi:uncharacterized membrane protein